MSLFGWFTGADARNDINKGYKSAKKDLTTGFDAQNRNYDEALGMVKPYSEYGGKANAMYNAMLGIDGVGAQKSAYDMVTSNPMFTNALNQENNALMRYLNSRGNLGGSADIAAQKVFQQNMGNWMNRYRDEGEQGLKAAAYGSNILQGKGDNAMGFGATMGNLNTQRSSAIAGTRNTAMNNLIGLTGALTGAGTAYSNYNTNNSLQNYFANQRINPWSTVVERS